MVNRGPCAFPVLRLDLQMHVFNINLCSPNSRSRKIKIFSPFSALCLTVIPIIPVRINFQVKETRSLGTSLLSYSQVPLCAHGSSFFKVGYPWLSQLWEHTWQLHKGLREGIAGNLGLLLTPLIVQKAWVSSVAVSFISESCPEWHPDLSVCPHLRHWEEEAALVSVFSDRS